MTIPFSSICCEEPSDVTKLIIFFASAVFVSILIKLISDFYNRRLHNNATDDYYVSGLTSSDIAQLPVTIFQKNPDGVTSECAICISELEHNEMVRTLPNCSHIFHKKCIDRWFGISGTCPVCRATIANAGQHSINPLSLPPGTSSSGTASAAVSEMTYTSASASTSPSNVTSISTSSHSDLDLMA